MHMHMHNSANVGNVNACVLLCSDQLGKREIVEGVTLAHSKKKLLASCHNS